MRTMRDSRRAILPVGAVNTKTGGNKMFGVIWSCWEEGEGTVELWQDVETGKFIAVTTSGQSREQIGARAEFKHDQTWRRIGSIWGFKFVCAFPWNEEGLRDVGLTAGATRVNFYCYK